MKKELEQAWINVLGIKPEETVRLNAKQAVDISLEYERLLCLPVVGNRLSYDELMEKAENDVAYKWLDEKGRIDFESGVLTGYGLAFK